MQKIEINLSSKAPRNRALLNVSAAAAALLAVILSWHNADTYMRNRSEQRRADERISELRERLPKKGVPKPGLAEGTDTRLLKKEVEFINGIIARKSFSWTELLWRLESHTPANVRLVRITPDFRDGRVNITGSAREMGDVLLMVDAMGKSGDFRDVFLLKHSEEKRGGGGGVISQRSALIIFNISAVYRADKRS